MRSASDRKGAGGHSGDQSKDFVQLRDPWNDSILQNRVERALSSPRSSRVASTTFLSTGGLLDRSSLRRLPGDDVSKLTRFEELEQATVNLLPRSIPAALRSGPQELAWTPRQ